MAQTPALYYHDGPVIDYTPVSAVVGGDVVVIGSIPMIAPVSIPAGVKGALNSGGVWRVPKTSDTFTAGDAVYWDLDGTPVTGTASSGAAASSAAAGDLMGVAVEDAATGESYVKVMLTAAKRTATIAGAVTADSLAASDSSLGVTGLTAAQGGAIVATGGTSTTSSNAGGAVSLIGGIGTTTAVGGLALVRGGAGTGAAVGGAAQLTGGLGGSSTTVGVGGAATVTAGAGQATAAGGIASLVGGASGTGATGNGGVAKVTGGAAASTDGNGGAVILTPGALAGTGKTGHVIIRNANIWRTFPAPEADLGAGDDTITVAMLQKGYCSISPTDADTLTTPTGAEIDAAFALQDLAADDSFDFVVANRGTGADDVITMTAGATGVTVTGNATVQPATSSIWRFRRTTTATYIVYKIAG